MPSYVVNKIATYDARLSLPAGAGSDSLHTNPEYCFAVALVETEGGL
jgi:L-fuconate dehydratase